MGNYVTGNNYFGYPFMQDNYEFWDYNGDGIHDHLYAGFSQPEHIAGEIHLGDSNFDDVIDIEAPKCGLYSAKLRDFNGDGYGDVAMGDPGWTYSYDDPYDGPQTFGGAGRTVVMFGNEPTPASCDDMPVKVHGVVSGPQVAWPKGVGDINGDSKSDLVLGYYLDYDGPPGGYCMTLWYGRESGTYINTEADAYF